MAIDSQIQQQASNPNTLPEKLRELATCEDVSIRQLVVANPNTPTEVLWRLGEEFPAQLLENLLLPLLFLEHINLIQEIPQKTLIRLFEIETVPDYLQQGLLQAAIEVREAIAANPNTPMYWLEQLAQDPDKRVRRRIAANPNTPMHWLEQLAQDQTVAVRVTLTYNRNLPITLLELLAQDTDARVRLALAYNRNLPITLLELLAQDTDCIVQREIARNPNTPAHWLERLAQKQTAMVRGAIAYNPNTPLDTLKSLVSDRDSFVRDAAQVELNKRFPELAQG